MLALHLTLVAFIFSTAFASAPPPPGYFKGRHFWLDDSAIHDKHSIAMEKAERASILQKSAQDAWQRVSHNTKDNYPGIAEAASHQARIHETESRKQNTNAAVHLAKSNPRFKTSWPEDQIMNSQANADTSATRAQHSINLANNVLYHPRAMHSWIADQMESKAKLTKKAHKTWMEVNEQHPAVDAHAIQIKRLKRDVNVHRSLSEPQNPSKWQMHQFDQTLQGSTAETERIAASLGHAQRLKNGH